MTLIVIHRVTLMNQSLRKTSTGISVEYSNKGFSHNLTGTNFSLEESKDHICLTIDLSANLRSRNKASTDYVDACELVKNNTFLKSVQLFEKSIIKGLLDANKRTPNASWELKILLGEKGTFKYTVKPSMVNGSVFLNVY